jgi:hypothetical protein
MVDLTIHATDQSFQDEVSRDDVLYETIERKNSINTDHESKAEKDG